MWQSTQAEDYTVDRKEVFEFTKKPTIQREGDRVTITFASKDYCDATIVIEKTDGTILRHLASGVLGKNPPEPFQPNTLEQTVVWDGKNDLGVYIDDFTDVRVRVSLGLKPRFEKDLFWHPKKRTALRSNPRIVAQPEGVYVYDGGGVEQVKLFTHDGQYLRTVYPFRSDKVQEVKGLGWREFPDGHKNPAHVGYWQATFLPGGSGFTEASWGTSARAFAVHDGRIALVPGDRSRKTVPDQDLRFTRFRTDGTTGGLPLLGPKIETPFPMHSAALSPDGKWLYLAGCFMNVQAPFAAMWSTTRWRHAVYRMEYAGNEPPKPWLGENDKPGKDEKHLNHPMWVCTDAKGRVYIADNQNDRVQILSPEGELLKSLPVKGPAVLQIHHKTQELYVFSWTSAMGYGVQGYDVPAVLRVFAPFENDQPRLQIPLPLERYGANITSGNFSDEMPFRAALDSYTEPPTVWMMTGYISAQNHQTAPLQNILMFQIVDGKLVGKQTWNNEVVQAVTRWIPPDCYRQRMFVDHTTGLLYTMEENRCVSVNLVRIEPETGKTGLLPLPYSANEMAFDAEGHILLRCDRLIGRFLVNGMREVPFDYGEEHSPKWDSFSKGGYLRSAIVLPGNRSVNWYESGMWVNPRGEIVVSAVNSAPRTERMRGFNDLPQAVEVVQRKYVPDIYPGRQRYSEIHMFDRHGKSIGMDIAGRGSPSGTATLVDTLGDVYFHTTRHRVYDGKPFEPLTGCVIKFKRGKGRFIAQSGGEIPLAGDLKPKGATHLSDGFWVEDAEWIYPGAGFSRDNAPCTCWNSHPTLDYLNRSFIPQYIRGQVAVLDSNGNLILQIGRYGNVDEGQPLVEDKRFRSEPPRSIGGDEVALMYANFTATHSDRRLFISDTGNSRILSVKLDYHATERLPLKKE